MSDMDYEFMGPSKDAVSPDPEKFKIGAKIYWKLDNTGLRRDGMILSWGNNHTVEIANAPNYTESNRYMIEQVFVTHVLDASHVEYTDIRSLPSYQPNVKKQPINIKDFPVGSRLKIRFANPITIEVEILAWDTSHRPPDHVRLMDTAARNRPILTNRANWICVNDLELVDEINDDYAQLHPNQHPEGSRVATIDDLGHERDLIVLDWKKFPNRTESKVRFSSGECGWINPDTFKVLEVKPIHQYNDTDYPTGSRLVVDVVLDGEYSGEIQVSVDGIDVYNGRVLLKKLNNSPFFDNGEADFCWCKFSEVNVITVLPQPDTTVSSVREAADFIQEEPSEDELSRQFHQHMRELKRVGELLNYNVSVTIV